MDMGDRLRAARERRGLKQGDVAARLGVSPITVTLWENKKNPRPVNTKYLRRLADILEISVSELLGETNATEQTAPPAGLVTIDLAETQLLRLFRLMPQELKLVQLAQFFECASTGNFGRPLGHERRHEDLPARSHETSDSR